MKKKILAVFLLFTILLSGCGVSTDGEVSGETVTFTDDLGRSVTVSNPKRVAALLGSFAQIWQLAGGVVSATADDAWEDLHLELWEDTVNLGNTKHLNLELLFASEPDFILASTNTAQNLEWKDLLEPTGIPVAYFDIDDFDDYLRLLKICTEITGKYENYELYGEDVQAQIDKVIEKSVQRVKTKGAPTVLCMVASASAVYAKNSDGNVLGAMLNSLGCRNIADSDSMLLENVSLEHILVSDPEYIFFVQRGDDEVGMKKYVQQFLMDNPAWSELTAVKNGRVYFMEKNLFNLKPNHRWGEAYEIMEEILANE